MDKVDDLIAGPIRSLLREPVADSEAADVAGRVRYWEQELARYRRAIIEETGPVDGTSYLIVERRKADRNYNRTKILSTVMDGLDMPPWQAFRALEDADAVRLDWQWSKLGRFFASNRLTLTVANTEIEDGDLDGPHVGQTWRTYLTVEGRKED